MKDEIIRLVTLHKFDRQILEIEDHLTALQKEITQADARLEKGRDQTDVKRREVELKKVESSRIDGDIDDAEQRYKSNSYQLMSLKDAKSYETMKLQMEDIREKISSLETRGVDLLNEIEDVEKTIALYEGKIAEEEARINGLKENLEKETESRSAEKGELKRKRSDYASHISPSVMRTYDRLLGMADRRALVELSGRTCTGCYANITMDNLEAVKSMQELVHCNNCGRIVYLPSVLGACED